MTEFEENQQAKRDRFAIRADNARAKGEQLAGDARRTASFIPMGQPILVGHHSERRHRNDLARINAKEDKARDEFAKAEHYERKARSYGTHSINSDDPDAITKLGDKLARMETEREGIKAANRLARKNGEEPRPGWVLSNLGGNIRRVRERIKVLEAEADRATPDVIQGEGFTVEECSDANRIRFVFDGKPSAAIRKIMKGHGFKWAPSVGAWQRQTTNDARYAAQCCRREIAALGAS